MAEQKSTRFDVRLSEEKRRELEELAGKLDLSVAGTARLAIARLIQQRDQVLGAAA